jgi:hypothetical protein
MMLAQAGVTAAGLTGGCDVQEASQVFAPWDDLS